MREARRVQDPRGDRLERLRRGNIAELIAAGLLMAKGYRILARRHRTPYGEIDVIAARWRRIAFVEVKAPRDDGRVRGSFDAAAGRAHRPGCGPLARPARALSRA